MNIPSSWRQREVVLMTVRSKYKHVQNIVNLRETVDTVTECGIYSNCYKMKRHVPPDAIP